MLTMIVLLIMVAVSGVAMEDLTDPRYQLVKFKNKTNGPIGVLTTSSGAPIPYEDATSSLDDSLINNGLFMESMSHLNRERIYDRGLHTKGTGAFGYFEVTHAIPNICKADFLSKVGMKTPIAVRFSATSYERGSPDYSLTTRGFATKFYTKEGNFDLVGFNAPIYIYKDPLEARSFVHAFRKNPATNLVDYNTMWDILTLLPHSLYIFLVTFAGRGIPKSYRCMPGYGIHTFQVVNNCGERHFVRFHIKPDAGIQNIATKDIKSLNGDYDYLTRDLQHAINKGDFPSWTVSLQILTDSDVKKEGSSVFDVTRTISLDKYPLHPIGKIVLNRNPKNYFAEMEQIAFCPANLVNGIIGAPDTLFQIRRFAYRDAQSYRLGGNFHKIPVNCPFQTKTFTYNRDGIPPVNDNEKDAPNYYPNSFHGPVPSMEMEKSDLIDIVEDKANNLDQVRELYTNELTTSERTQLITNISFMLKGVTKVIRDRAIKALTNIHSNLGNGVARALNITMY